jgi:hypothetical protein
MKRIAMAYGLTALCSIWPIWSICSVAVSAQTNETHTKSKVVVKDGKELSVTGCVVATSGGDTGFMLTNVADKTGALHDYVLVSEDTDLSRHVGHRVEIKGKVTDRGGAKVETETRTKTTTGDNKESRTKTEVQGDVAGPYLGVKTLRMIAAACP